MRASLNELAKPPGGICQRPLGRSQRFAQSTIQQYFDGWQSTHAGEREVKIALRKTLFKYKLHQDAAVFDKAYGYIREYY